MELKSGEEAAAVAAAYVREGLSPSEAARRAASETGMKKGDVYRALMRAEAVEEEKGGTV